MKNNIRPGTLLRYHALKNVLEFEVKDSSIILDIGGYDGYISYNLKKKLPNLNITVVDIDKSGLKLAKQRGLNTLYASALNLPIESNQIDVVFCFSVIEHIRESEKLVREISRVLKKGGKIILTTPQQNGVSFPFLSKKKIEIINKSWGHIYKGFSLKNIEKLYENSGLEIEKKSKYFNFFTRSIYAFSFIYNISFKGKSMLYWLIVKLEPYIKFKGQVHLIVGKKIKS